MARSSRVCGISGAQSFKILRQITAAADCGQRADVGSWSWERGLWGRRAHERGRSLVGKTLATCGQHLLGGIACGSRHEAGMMRDWGVKVEVWEQEGKWFPRTMQNMG